MKTHLTRIMRTRTASATLALAALTLPLSAQQVAPPAPPASSAEVSEEVTVLPEFSVSAKQTNDYLPAEATTGTRVATKIQDLPFSVGVVTSEFLEDFAATELIDQMAYSSGVTVSEIPGGGTYNARGIEASIQLRNGFRRIGMIDSVTTDRVEVIKGANAGIYGPTAPGGVINTITKQPKTKRENNLKFRVGNNGYYRGEASSTGPLGNSGKLFYLVTLAGQMNNFDVEYKRQTQDVLSGNLLWKITPRTSLSLELEYMQRRDIGSYSGATGASIREERPDPYYARVSAADTPRNMTNPRAYYYYTGVATSVLDINTQGPNAEQYRDNKSATLSFNHRFNQTFSLRSAANGFIRTTTRQEFGIPDYDAASDSFSRNNVQPDYRPIDDGGVTFQTDLLATWKTGSVKHKTLLTFDYQRITTTSQRYDSYYDSALDTTTRGTAANPAVRGSVVVAYPQPGAPNATIGGSTYDYLAYPSSRDIWDWSTSPNKTTTYGDSGGANIYTIGTNAAPAPVGTPITLPSGQKMVVRSNGGLGVPRTQMDYRIYPYKTHPEYYYASQNSQTAIDLYGVFLSERATMWDDRINLFAGVRLDCQRNHSKDFLNATSQEVWTTEPSYQLGATIRLVPGLNAFANACRSFIPNNVPGAIDVFGNPFVPPDEIGKSWEVGFKISAFHDRLNATLSRYDINLNNVSQTGYTDTGAPYTAVAGLQISRGYEIDLNWKPIDPLQLTANYAYNETRTTGNTSGPGFDGGPTRRAPRNTASIAAKYTFSGQLKGLSLTTGLIYKDRMIPFAPGGRAVTTGSGEVQNLRMPNGELLFQQNADLSHLPEGAILAYQAKIPGTNQYYSFRADDGRESIWNPPYALWQAGIRYQFRPKRGYTASIQFNMTNILDRQYLVGNFGVGEGRGWTMTCALKF